MNRRFVLKLSHAAAVLSVVLVAPMALAGCSHSSPWEKGRLRVIGVERQYANLAAQLGGRYVSVISIIDNPSIDPHSFEVTTSLARDVSQANLVIQNGLGYDSFINSLESATSPPRRSVISVAQVFNASSATLNPHLWYRILEMPRLAQSITRHLERLDRGHRLYFQSRLRQLERAISRLAVQIANFRRAHHNSSAVVTEPVANYLLAELGVSNATPSAFERAVMNGIDPAPQDVAHALSLVQRRRIDALVFNAQVSGPSSEELVRVAARHSVPRVAVYETMPLNYDYQGWMSAEIRALDRAFSGHQSTVSL